MAQGEIVTSKERTPQECGAFSSLAETELFYDGLIARDICAVEVPQEAAALAYELDEPSPAGVIMAVGAEMIGQRVDAVCEEGDLNLC
jgi:hypothetical protein